MTKNKLLLLGVVLCVASFVVMSQGGIYLDLGAIGAIGGIFLASGAMIGLVGRDY